MGHAHTTPGGSEYTGWTEAQRVAELGLLEQEQCEYGCDHTDSLQAVYEALDAVRGL